VSVWSTTHNSKLNSPAVDHLVWTHLIDNPILPIVVGFLAFKHNESALHSAGISTPPPVILAWNVYMRLVLMLQPLWTLFINARQHRQEYQAGEYGVTDLCVFGLRLNATTAQTPLPHPSTSVPIKSHSYNATTTARVSLRPDG
jgi:hypothetical protein